jgi:hypothetical protein
MTGCHPEARQYIIRLHEKMYACNNMVNPNNPVVILRFAILSDSADRGRSIIRVTIWFTFI